MLSLNTLRNKFGIVLMVFIAVALLSFILGEFKGCTQNEEPVVAKIGAGDDAKEVAYTEFNAAYNEASALYGDNNAVDQAMVVATALEMLKDEHITLPALAELGLTVTEAERNAMWDNQVSSSFLQQVFRMYDGKYNPEAVEAYLDAVRSGAQSQYVFSIMDKQMVVSRAKEKFINLAYSGIYANSLELQKDVNAENNIYKGQYVLCEYASVADADVEVSENEIEAYYSANLAQYKYDEPYRTISYVHFSIPTGKDVENVEAESNKVYNSVEEFVKAANGSVENFEKAARSASQVARSLDLKKGQRSIQGLNNSLDIVRWAYQANVGQMSPVFDLNGNGWVVAILTSADVACEPLAEVSAEIKSVLANQKKAALLKAKMQGATLKEIAANVGSKVESFVGVKSTSEINGDSRVAVALEAVTAEATGKVLPLVEGAEGVYAVVVTEVKEAEEKKTLETEQLVARATEVENAYNSETWFPGKGEVLELPNGGMQYISVPAPEYIGQLGKAIQDGVKVVDNTLQYF